MDDEQTHGHQDVPGAPAGELDLIGVRAILLDLFDRAMREQWGDRESWEASRAAVAEARARFGWAGVDAYDTLERRAYRLFVHSPAAEDVERERRAARAVRRSAPG